MLRAWRLVELAVLFVALPVGLYFGPQRIPPLPFLWLIALGCYLVLRRDPTFDRDSLWRPAAIRQEWKPMLALFAVATVLLLAAMAWLAPRLLFGLVRTHPVLWAVIMVLYPVLSVYPQGLIYRSFVMHRYAPLVGGRRWALILLSAGCFSMLHVVFRNPMAMALTFPGGLLFAWRQQKTRSLFVSSVEHALYGCLMFTAGLGVYFYARFI